MGQQKPLRATALIVEDDPMQREMICLLLEESDYDVIQCESAEAAVLIPNAEVVIDPTLVTDVMPTDRDVLACGPEPMLEAVRALVPDAQLAWEAPMACGYGACYGCVVEVEGAFKRLCVEGPVLCF